MEREREREMGPGTKTWRDQKKDRNEMEDFFYRKRILLQLSLQTVQSES